MGPRRNCANGTSNSFVTTRSKENFFPPPWVFFFPSKHSFACPLCPTFLGTLHVFFFFSAMSATAPVIDLAKLLNTSVVGAAGEDGFYATTPAIGTLVDGKAVGLYFSASWCPPCKKFTPLLAEAYRKQPVDAPRLEIIYVSSDHDDEEFADYFGKMPWLAVNYEREDVREALKAALSVKMLPTLVVIGHDGRVLATNGRGAIESNATKTLAEWATAASAL
jgi:thiol-disulfide isomerase/thioredoxin